MIDLARRYIDDRDGLSNKELADLDEMLVRDPGLVAEIQEQLITKHALSLTLNSERDRFEEGVALLVASDDKSFSKRIMRRVKQQRSCKRRATRRSSISAASNSHGATRVVLAAAAVLAVCAIAMVVLYHGTSKTSSRPLLTHIQGEVKVNATTVRENTRIGIGSSIATDSSGTGLLTYADGTSLRLGTNTALVLQGNKRSKGVRLTRGWMSASVAKQKSAMVLVTDHARVVVLGTSFILYTDSLETRIEMQSGRVRFDDLATGKSREVVAGQTASTRRIRQSKPTPAKPAAKPTGWAGRITGFSLIDADTDRVVAPISNGSVIDLKKLGVRKFNIRIETVGGVGSVAATADGRIVQNLRRGFENTVPFSLAGDMNEDYHPWPAAPGTHTIEATPYERPDGEGKRGKTLRIQVKVR